MTKQPKFTVDSKELAKALTVLKGITQNKSPLPILSDIHFLVRKSKKAGAVTVTATDLEHWCSITLETSKAKAPGEFLLGGMRNLLDLLKSRDGNLTVKAIDEIHSSVSFGDDITAEFVSCSVKDYPSVKSIKRGENVCSLRAADLDKIIRSVSFAHSREISHYAINGILLRMDGKDKLEVIATDGYRLAMHSANANCKDVLDLLIPFSPSLLRMMEAGKKDVTVKIYTVKNEGGNLNAVWFEGKRWSFTSKLVNEKFPNFEKAIPKCKKGEIIEIKLAAKPFIEAASNMAGLCTYGKILLSVKDGHACLCAESMDTGKMSLRIKTKAKNVPDNWSIAFKAHHITSLKEWKSENLRFEFGKAEMDQIVVHGDSGEQCVIMPMRQ